jgi:hypothetical protein
MRAQQLQRLVRALDRVQGAGCRDGDVLAQRDVTLEACQRLQRGGTVTGEQVRLGQVPACVDAQVLQPQGLAPGQVLREPRMGDAPPLGQRCPERQRRRGRVLRVLGASSRDGEFEVDRVDRDALQVERVTRRSREDRVAADQPT